MRSLRKILYPLGLLYGLVAALRNAMFDFGWLKSYRFPVPVIAVGNLSVGGTGKSPMIEYLIRLLSNQRIATLSRGYKRKSKGFLLANAHSTVAELGDEPFQFHRKFPQVRVAVDANRKHGIEQLLALENPPEVILLDDAFQHRRVHAHLYIMLTAYGDLYTDDLVLPAGNLREFQSGANRAQIIVVTKCPMGLPEAEQQKIRKKLRIAPHQSLFFTAIGYDDQVFSESGALPLSGLASESRLLLAGIAKPQPFFNQLQNGRDETLEFPDHHDFSEADLTSIISKANGRKIITTEKDYVRLQGKIPQEQLYYVPIQCVFLGAADGFNHLVMKVAASKN